MRKFLCVFALFLCLATSVNASPRQVLVVQQQRNVVVRQAVVVQRNVVVQQQPTVIIQNRGLFRGFLFGPRVTVIR